MQGRSKPRYIGMQAKFKEDRELDWGYSVHTQESHPYLHLELQNFQLSPLHQKQKHISLTYVINFENDEWYLLKVAINIS